MLRIYLDLIISTTRFNILILNILLNTPTIQINSKAITPNCFQTLQRMKHIKWDKVRKDNKRKRIVEMDKHISVLLVDDLGTMRRIAKNGLKKIGFNNFVEAEDGVKALEKLKTDNIGLILADWNMPNMSGIELLKIVKNDEKLKKIPFIMVTAEGSKENVVEAVKSGVDNYLVKPYTAEQLKDKIGKVLK